MVGQIILLTFLLHQPKVGHIAEAQRFNDIVLIQSSIKTFPEILSFAEHNRDDDDVSFVDQPLSEKIAQDTDTTANTDVLITSGCTCELQNLLRGTRNEPECRSTLHLNIWS